MAFAIKNTLRAVESHLKKSRVIRNVQVWTITEAPSERFLAEITVAGTEVVEVALGGAASVEVHTIMVRLYRTAFEVPADGLEYDMAEGASLVHQDLMEDFTLGGTSGVQNLDIGGIYGTSLSAKFGFADIGGVIFRICDITVPVIVRGSATPAP